MNININLSKPIQLELLYDNRIDTVLGLLNQVINKENKMSQELDALTAQVAANTAIEESAVTLIQGIAAQIAAAGVDQTKLDALKASLQSSAADLAAAVAANTV